MSEQPPVNSFACPRSVPGGEKPNGVALLLPGTNSTIFELRANRNHKLGVVCISLEVNEQKIHCVGSGFTLDEAKESLLKNIGMILSNLHRLQ